MAVTVKDEATAEKVQLRITSFDLPFWLILLFLFFDYGRPQSFFPSIGALHLGWVIQPLLFFYLLHRGKLFDLKNIKTKCLLGLVLLMTFHVPIAINNYHAFVMWRGYVLYFIVYLSIINFVNTLPKLERFITIWIVINLLCAA